MSVFNADSVTIVRKKGDRYFKQQINAGPVLPGSELARERIRTGVISRLRKDPSVVLVLEDRSGRANEIIPLQDGFEMSVELLDGESPRAGITIRHQGEKVFEEEITQDPEETDFCTVPNDLVEEVIDLITSISEKDYSFFSNDSIRPAEEEPGEDVDINTAKRIMEEAGFQTEPIYTVAGFCEPFLFVHENEVVLMGSRRFDGELLFIEMKRLFIGVEEDVVRQGVEKVRRDCPLVKIFQCGDCSWSFRVDMDMDLYTDNFLEKLESDMNLVRETISGVEACDGIGGVPWPIMREQRQLFIHEMIDASASLNAINI